jgi:hypothetical protein
VGLERGPLIPLGTIEELLGRSSIGSGLENREYGRGNTLVLTTRHPLSAEVDTNFAEMRRSPGRYSLLGTETTEFVFSVRKLNPKGFSEINVKYHISETKLECGGHSPEPSDSMVTN